MKKQLSVVSCQLFVAALGCVLLTGCIHNAAASAPAPLPVGAVNAIDANANAVLQAAGAFALRVSSDIQSGKLLATPTQRSAMDKLDAALNVADSAEVAYHNGGGGDAGILNAAIAAVQSAFSQAQVALTPTTTAPATPK